MELPLVGCAGAVNVSGGGAVLATLLRAYESAAAPAPDGLEMLPELLLLLPLATEAWGRVRIRLYKMSVPTNPTERLTAKVPIVVRNNTFWATLSSDNS